MKASRQAGLAVAALCAALAAPAAEWRSSALEIASWNAAASPTNMDDSVFSPVGFGVTVAMLGEGLGGSARAEMAEMLGLISDFSVAFGNVLKSYAAANVSNRVSVTIASSLWTTRRRALGADYILALQRGFEAEAGFLSGILPVNAWTEAKTEGRITNVLPEMPRKVDTLVVGAVAFEGAWRRPFDDEKGRPGDFTRADGSKVKLTFLRTECPVVRVATERFTAAKAEFAANGMSFLAVIPAEGVSLAELREKDFANGGIDELKALMRARSGDGVEFARSRFAIPRFSIRSDWRLEGALREVKMPQTGFDRMGEGSFVVNDVRQAAYISISGKGYSLTPGMEPEPQDVRGRRRPGELVRKGGTGEDGDDSVGGKAGVPFLCDRPFLFFVWDVGTDTFVLAGQFTGSGHKAKQPKKGDQKR